MSPYLMSSILQLEPDRPPPGYPLLRKVMNHVKVLRLAQSYRMLEKPYYPLVVATSGCCKKKMDHFPRY